MSLSSFPSPLPMDICHDQTSSGETDPSFRLQCEGFEEWVNLEGLTNKIVLFHGRAAGNKVAVNPEHLHQVCCDHECWSRREVQDFSDAAKRGRRQRAQGSAPCKGQAVEEPCKRAREPRGAGLCEGSGEWCEMPLNGWERGADIFPLCLWIWQFGWLYRDFNFQETQVK